MGDIHQIFNYYVSTVGFERNTKTKNMFKSKFYTKNIQQFVNGERRKEEYDYCRISSNGKNKIFSQR